MEGFSESLAGHGAWEFEPATGRTRWSTALFQIHGVSPDDFVPSVESVRPLVHEADRDTYTEIVRDAVSTGAPFACQHRIVRPDGEVRILIVRGSFVEGHEDVPDRLIGTTQDVTGKEGEEERLWHLANHDSLSGLFNRRRFMEELSREIAATTRSGEPGAVLMLDLDRFKDINDSLGHMAGDALLTSVAETLRKRLRDTDTLARLGGDEFAIVLPGCPPEKSLSVARELLAALEADAEVKLGGVQRTVSASIGVAAFDSTRRRGADELLVEADLAMYRAKMEGRGRAEVFDEVMRDELAARISTEGELHDALGGHELLVQYQPIVSLIDGATVGCEALVRWQHPERGMVGPGDFVPIAEETGLIARIGRFVLERACHQAAKWHRSGRELFVSVNVSPLQLTRSDIVTDVSGALAASGLPARQLCLEITESSLLHDSSPLLGTLDRLRALGVRIALDDFGGGASSLGLLRLLPIEQIKIDRLFIEDIGGYSNDRAIVGAVISLANELGLSVIAEGVETERQQDELRELGAELAQGFLYSPARFAAELELDGFAATVIPS